MEELEHKLGRRPLHFIWILDCSEAMTKDYKIQALNTWIKQTIDDVRRFQEDNPGLEILIQAVTFSDGAQWHISEPTSVMDLEWKDVSAGGARDMGKALSLVALKLSEDRMQDQSLKPVLVLVSDGHPTDDYARRIDDLNDQKWGRKATRIAIAISEAKDPDFLKRFADNPKIPDFQAKVSLNVNRSLIDTIRYEIHSYCETEDLLPSLSGSDSSEIDYCDIW